MALRSIGRMAVMAFATAIAVAASAQDNLLSNGDFEADTTDPWGVYGDATLTLDTVDKHGGSASAKVEVNSVGANFWDAGLQYNVDVSFSGGTLYTWAAFVKSDGTKEINWKPELAEDPWTALAEEMQASTADWAEYYVEFTPDADVGNGSLTLHIQLDDQDFWIDDARWYEGAYVPGDTGSPTAVEADGRATTTWGAIKTR